jgi:Na+/H+ antiporter NhaD/arsenite permease-like protein
MPLVEPEIKALMQHSLMQCHRHRISYYSYILNIALIVFIIVIIGVFVYIKWNYRPSEDVRLERQRQERESIVSQIQFYRQQADASKITDLPVLHLKPTDIEVALRADR